MSDFEHELILDLGAVRSEAENLRMLARQALVAAASAQEAAYGRHDGWIDEAMRDTTVSSAR